MENIVEIYWYDLPEEKQRELLDAGFDNQNIVDGIFPLTHIFIDLEEVNIREEVKVYGK